MEATRQAKISPICPFPPPPHPTLLLGTHSDTLLTYRKELLKGEERGKILKVHEKQGWGKKHYAWKENTFSKCRLNPIRIKISHIVLSLELINSVTPIPSPVIPPAFSSPCGRRSQKSLVHDLHLLSSHSPDPRPPGRPHFCTANDLWAPHPKVNFPSSSTQ